MRKRPSYTYVTREALTDAGMSRKDKALFHYFNPNGLHAQWKFAAARVSDLVDLGLGRSGWLIAYGTLATISKHHQVNRLSNLALRKRPPYVALWSTLDSLREEIALIHSRVDVQIITHTI